jgi:hypothetical protein
MWLRKEIKAMPWRCPMTIEQQLAEALAATVGDGNCQCRECENAIKALNAYDAQREADALPITAERLEELPEWFWCDGSYRRAIPGDPLTTWRLEDNGSGSGSWRLRLYHTAYPGLGVDKSIALIDVSQMGAVRRIVEALEGEKQ